MGGSQLGIHAELTRPIIGAAIEVHRQIGPGLMESAYELCLCHELKARGIQCLRQVEIPLVYKGIKLECGYRADIVVGDVVLELKAVEALLPLHEAQLMTYMRLLKKSVGLLINFNVPVLKHGIRRRLLAD
jgi:GxxExxY protein